MGTSSMRVWSIYEIEICDTMFMYSFFDRPLNDLIIYEYIWSLGIADDNDVGEGIKCGHGRGSSEKVIVLEIS